MCYSDGTVPRRNCTDISTFRTQARDLTNRILQRGYPRKVVSRAYQRALGSNRQELLKPRRMTRSQKICCITAYNNQWNDLRTILSKHWNALLTDNELNVVVGEKPSLTARRSENLRHMLCRSHFQRPGMNLGCGVKIVGNFPCGYVLK